MPLSNFSNACHDCEGVSGYLREYEDNVTEEDDSRRLHPPFVISGILEKPEPKGNGDNLS